jgi:hypothetical protein
LLVRVRYQGTSRSGVSCLLFASFSSSLVMQVQKNRDQLGSLLMVKENPFAVST